MIEPQAENALVDQFNQEAASPLARGMTFLPGSMTKYRSLQVPDSFAAAPGLQRSGTLFPYPQRPPNFANANQPG